MNQKRPGHGDNRVLVKQTGSPSKASGHFLFRFFQSRCAVNLCDLCMFLEPAGFFVRHALELFVAQYLVAHLPNKLGGAKQGSHLLSPFSFRFRD